MNKFQEIVYKILVELGYEDTQAMAIEEGINSVLFKNSQKEESQYYVVSTCNEEFFQNINMEELQIIIYDKIKNLLEKTPAVDKNTSWIIGVECNSNYEDIMSKVLQIEENPYYLKKMVCPYLQEELNEFIDEIEGNSKYIEYIQKEVLDVNRFTGFYEGKDIVYDFISRLFIKLPSIELPVIKDKGLNNLSDEIEKKVIENELQKMHTFLIDNIKDDTNLTDDGITTLYELYFGKDTENEKI